MGRPIKNIEQIRSLLGRMDRLIDDARMKREGGPLPPPSPAPVPRAPSMPAMPNTNGAPPPAPRMGAAPSPQTSTPPSMTGPLQPNGRSNSQSHSTQPQRLKAKPKRPGSDPLQDFQQRQAS